MHHNHHLLIAFVSQHYFITSSQARSKNGGLLLLLRNPAGDNRHSRSCRSGMGGILMKTAAWPPGPAPLEIIAFHLGGEQSLHHDHPDSSGMGGGKT